MIIGTLFSLVKWGVGGSVVIAPVAYVAGSSNSWETLWFQRIGFPNEVLDCKVDGVSGGGRQWAFWTL